MFDFSQIMHMSATLSNTDGQLAALLRSRTSLWDSVGKDSQQLAQRISVAVPNTKRGIVLEFNVVVILSLVENQDEPKNALRVTWNSAGSGRFPSFGGVLRLERDAREHCRLVLEGGYEEADSFEAAGGGVSLDYRICVSTARALLEEVRIHLERAIQATPAESAAMPVRNRRPDLHAPDSTFG